MGCLSLSCGVGVALLLIYLSIKLEGRLLDSKMDRSRGCDNSSREMGELATRVDMLADRLDMLIQDRSETYRRIGTLESRMAQVTLIAGMAALILPAILTFFVKN